jgi:hypothetical protein
MQRKKQSRGVTIVSNEIKCHVLVYGPPSAVVAFTDEFERDKFQAHVPIAPDAQPQEPCGAGYVSRRLAEEHWGSRFIYPRPGVTVYRGSSPTIEDELRFISQEGYELHTSPSPSDAVALIAFTVPTDPPALWAESVIRHYYDHGLMFIVRWWDMENYHRCVDCGALDGICLRVGAFWSVPSKDHAAYWYGKTGCHCSGGFQMTRKIGGNDFNDDDAIASMTAFVDGPAVRIVSTGKTGKRFMQRFMTLPRDANRLVDDINSKNIALDGVRAAT